MIFARVFCSSYDDPSPTQKMAKVAATRVVQPPPKPVEKEEKKEKVLIPGKKLDPTKNFPGKGYQITGKVVSEEDVKAALAVSFIVYMLFSKIEKGTDTKGNGDV